MRMRNAPGFSSSSKLLGTIRPALCTLPCKVHSAGLTPIQGTAPSTFVPRTVAVSEVAAPGRRGPNRVACRSGRSSGQPPPAGHTRYCTTFRLDEVVCQSFILLLRFLPPRQLNYLIQLAAFPAAVIRSALVGRVISDGECVSGTVRVEKRDLVSVTITRGQNHTAAAHPGRGPWLGS